MAHLDSLSQVTSLPRKLNVFEERKREKSGFYHSSRQTETISVSSLVC